MAIKKEECFEWRGCKEPAGYGHVTRKGKAARVHRDVYLSYYGPIPTGMCVCHSCDNRACINPDHLFLATLAGNCADMVRKGRQAKGIKKTLAKLNDEKVIAIRLDNSSHREIARRYGVSQPLITMVKTRKIWRHVL